MAESDAERQRRARRHRADDHTLCIPGRCPAVTPTVTETVTPEERDAARARGPLLGPSGSALWQEMTDGHTMPAMQAVLLLEACRIADRLDKLDAQLRGEDWLRFLADEDSGAITVIVDKLLAESRQQATALKGIIAELRQASGAKPSKSRTPAKGSGSGIADITARIAARRAASSD